MNFDAFITELNSIKNPEDRYADTSQYLDLRMKLLEDNYKLKSNKELLKLKNEINNLSPLELIKKLKTLSKARLKLILILDDLEVQLDDKCSVSSKGYDTSL